VTTGTHYFVAFAADATVKTIRRRLSSRVAEALSRFAAPEMTLGGGLLRSRARSAVATTCCGDWKPLRLFHPEPLNLADVPAR
jgi:hypothetical protein